MTPQYLGPTAEVHSSVVQAINYLAEVDEHRDRIREEFGLETRRVGATVLTSNPRLHQYIGEHHLNDALRTLNAHTNRGEVLTYTELLNNAERVLDYIPTP